MNIAGGACRANSALFGLLLLPLTQTVGCGAREAAPPPKIHEETAEDEIRSVSSTWQAVQQKKGLESEPSRISVFTQRIESKLELGAEVRERLNVSEEFELRDGTRFRCQSQGEARITLDYGRRAGEAALQINRAPTVLQRRCQPAGFPEERLELPSGPARFVLRSDQLVGVEPPLEKRVYLPLH